MFPNHIPSTVKALVASPDLGLPKVTDIPFGTRDDVQHLDSQSVVVANRAIGLNPTDYKHAHGEWSSKKPVIIGTDASGIALKVGTNVSHIKQGDRVAGMVYGCSREEQGACSEGVVFDAANAFVMPPGMSYLEGAAFTAVHLTVVQTFYMRWNLHKPSAPDKSSPKQILLIWGGSTAVGHHAVQLATLSGYRVFVTASPANHTHLRDIGADQCFDYRDPNVVEAIKKAAGEQGIFAAYDTAGANGSVESCIDAIGSNGGRVMSTLPFGEETADRRKDVKPEFTLVYTVVGYPFKFANAFDFPAMPEDRARSLAWMSEELPLLLEGWQEGKGSLRYKPQKLRIMDGHLDRVHEGIDVLGRGDYKAEKLVYNLA